MSKSEQAVKITLLGKEYQINVAPEKKETLMRVREYLDQRMRDSKKQYQLTASENVAVITALNLANEVLIQKETLANHTKRLQKLTKTLSGVI